MKANSASEKKDRPAIFSVIDKMQAVKRLADMEVGRKFLSEVRKRSDNNAAILEQN